MKPAPIDPPEIHNYLWEGYSGNIGWDVGANCGQTINEMSRRFKQVHAFEPAEECWPYLERFQQIHLHKIAVSDTNGAVPLVALPDKIDTGQLVTGNCLGMEWNPQDERGEVRTLEARTADALALEYGYPDFMKIDVEGHEEKVLKGATYLLTEIKPDLLIEFHSPELYHFCVDLLLGLRYDVETVRHPHYPKDSSFWHQHGWLKAFAKKES